MIPALSASVYEFLIAGNLHHKELDVPRSFGVLQKTYSTDPTRVSEMGSRLVRRRVRLLPTCYQTSVTKRLSTSETQAFGLAVKTTDVHLQV